MPPDSQYRIQRVTVAGAGTMGLQIAVQVAAKGIPVCLYDRDPKVLSQVPGRCRGIPASELLPFVDDAGADDPADWMNFALEQIDLSADLPRAAECDLLLEAVTENLDVKRDFYEMAGAACPPQTIFLTNSSSLLPSSLARFTGRPDRFAALHFALGSSLIEVMPHPGTAPETVAVVEAFARRVASLTVLCRKEARGYVLNRLLMYINAAAIDLAAEGVATPADIDRVCMLAYGARIGPFGSLDAVGLDTAWSISEGLAALDRDPKVRQRADFLKQYVDRGDLGRKSGCGFYHYPHPDFQQPDFLRNELPREGESTPLAGQSAWPVEPPPEQLQMGRFGLSLVETAWPDCPPGGSRPSATAVIVGDNPTAEALVRRLQAVHPRVEQIRSCSPLTNALNQFDSIVSRGAVTDLFLITGRDAAAAAAIGDRQAWERRREAGITGPYLLCQRWFRHIQEQSLAEQARLIGVIGLGGDFGLSGDSSAVEGGAISGLFKALRVEIPALGLVKVVDAPLHEPPDSLAESVLRELSGGSADVEVGIRQGTRSVLRAVRQQARDLARRPVTPGGTWIVTGGGRGITALCAREFARRHRLKLHLLGTSPPPPADGRWRGLSDREVFRQAAESATEQALNKGQALNAARKMLEVDRTLQACRDAGVGAMYHACDAGDLGELADVLARVRQVDGPIRGIIHGAGVDTGMPFLMTPPRSLEQVARSKLDGAQGLMQLTAADPLEYFIGFGSTSGRFGAFCNADYSLANDMLAKMIDAFAAQRPECTSLTVHWTAWDDVGMCMRPQSRKGLEMFQIRLMPAAEGVAHFIEAVEADAADRELVIIDHPGGVLSSHVTLAETD